MRNLAIVIFLLGTVFVSATVGQDTSVALKLYIKAGAVGDAQDIPPGTYRVDSKTIKAQDGSDVQFSVRVAEGFRARFCDSTETTANCEEFTTGVHDLKGTSFVMIKVWKQVDDAVAKPEEQPPVIVYEAMNWGGRSQVFMPGMYRSIRGEFGRISDNQAMSAVVSKGFKVRFCADEGYAMRGAGDCEEHEEGRVNLRFSNSISFIEVIDLDDQSPADETMPVVLYEDKQQGGKRQGYDIGTFFGSSEPFRKLALNSASSISVKRGFEAVICVDEPVGNGEPKTCEHFTAGKHDLKNKDAAHYLKVIKQ